LRRALQNTARRGECTYGGLGTPSKEGASMLAVTEAAADAISALTAQEGVQQQGGLRFAMRSLDDSQTALALSVAPAPTEGDEVVTADDGAQIFLEPQAAEFLSDKVLDVQQDAEGQLSFAVMDRS
jgi:iron-sulfur cluster assembly protein